MHWNFRVLRHGKGKDVYYAIHEVFYDDKGKPTSCTKNPIDVGSESPKAIKWMLRKMQLGSKSQVLAYESFERRSKQ